MAQPNKQSHVACTEPGFRPALLRGASLTRGRRQPIEPLGHPECKNKGGGGLKVIEVDPIESECRP